MVAFVEHAVRRITGGERSGKPVHAVEAGRLIDNSASFYRRRRFAELSQPHPTSQTH